LTETLNELIDGLLPSELNKELITLIPEDTKLLSVTVEEGTAYLNFNEAFRFNTLGSEGLKAQLRQIVYTTTEFSTVKNVQILIEGKKQNYLGPEGVYIGTPLNRHSF
jgi:spore germination protein GerM